MEHLEDPSQILKNELRNEIKKYNIWEGQNIRKKGKLKNDFS